MITFHTPQTIRPFREVALPDIKPGTPSARRFIHPHSPHLQIASASAIALSSNVIYGKAMYHGAFSFLLCQLSCTAGERRAQAAGVDGAYGAVTT